MTAEADDTQSAVALEFQDFRTFIDTFSANISEGGMFLELAESRSPESEIEFDLKLADGDSLIQGRGKVAWVRIAVAGGFVNQSGQSALQALPSGVVPPGFALGVFTEAIDIAKQDLAEE